MLSTSPYILEHDHDQTYFSEINSISGYYDYINKNVIAPLYKNNLDVSTDVTNPPRTQAQKEQNMQDSITKLKRQVFDKYYILGQIRIRQVKTKQYVCACGPACDNQMCYYDTYDEDTRYTEQLTAANKDPNDSFMNYLNVGSTNSLGTIYGKFNTYSSDGYLQDLQVGVEDVLSKN